MAKLDDSSKRDLLTLPQVIGVGYGYKIVKGIPTNQEALVVLVSKKLVPEQLVAHELVPYIIACLKRFVDLADYPTLNEVDCAIGEPLENSMIIPEILEIGLVQGVTTQVLNMEVKKSGRTSGLTFGQIILLDAVVDVQYSPGRILRFDHQIVTTNISSTGDSGSLVLDTNNLAVGLLFAGSSTVTIVNPIQTVLDLLGVNFGGWFGEANS